MPVKPIQSAVRVLDALAIIARQQPIGVAELARRLDHDKSSAQRVLATLASSGWIRAVADDGPTRWELTTRLLAIASDAQARAGLGHALHSLMVSLRDRTGETVICAVPDVERVVISDVVESTQLVRSAPTIGLVVPTEASASGRALLAAMERADRERLAGRALPSSVHAELDAIRRRGWSISRADAAGGEGSINLGAAVTDRNGVPIAAIAVSAVSFRMPRATQQRTGRLLAEAVSSLWNPDAASSASG